MERRNISPRLFDILENIDIVAGIVADCDSDRFRSDRVLRLALEREIVSEAVRHIPEEVRSDYPNVPWRNIVAIGNKLRHEYQRVDSDIIWEIAGMHLPNLRPTIEDILTRQK